MSLLLVYGTLQRRQRNHWRLYDSRYLGLATIKGRLFQFKGFDFPILWRHSSCRGLVHGELYKVSRAILDVQDAHEYWYKRVKVLAYQDWHPISCWVYEGLSDIPFQAARELKAGRWPS